MASAQKHLAENRAELCKILWDADIKVIVTFISCLMLARVIMLMISKLGFQIIRCSNSC